MPATTVLMGVHNGERYLAETLSSVAAQTFADYEFVIVDDASTDGTGAMLAAAASSDARIRVIRNADNQGLTCSLNIGLTEARGRYIARIDADDSCHAERLARQFAFMESHPDHAGVACGFDMVDGAGRLVQRVDKALDDWQVRWIAGWNPPAPHPTYFFRRLGPNGMPNLYDESFRTAQDFDFWSRLSEQGKTCVLPDVLVSYRRHEGAITHVRRLEQAANCALTGRRNLSARLPREIAEALEPLVALFAYERRADPETIRDAVAGVDAMLAHDLVQAPSARHRAWIRRMSAGLLATGVLARGGGLGSSKLLATFLWEARSHLPWLANEVAASPRLALKTLRTRRRN